MIEGQPVYVLDTRDDSVTVTTVQSVGARYFRLADIPHKFQDKREKNYIIYEESEIQGLALELVNRGDINLFYLIINSHIDA